MSLGAPATPIAFEQRLSHAQFLDALLGIVSKALPVVKKILPTVEQLVPAIGGLLKGGGAAACAAVAAARLEAAPTTAPAKPDLGTLLAQLLQQITQATGANPPAATRRSSRHASGAKQQSRSFAQSAPHRYSYASWAQLLAALPALSGVLEKVLTPETMQALIGAGDPNKLMKTVFDGLTSAAKIGQEATDKLHEHLRALNPGLGDDVLIPLLASMSMSRTDRAPQAVAPGEPRHRRPRPGRPRRLPAGGVPPRRRDQPARHRRHRPPDPPAHAASPAQGRRHARHSGDAGVAVRPPRSRSDPAAGRAANRR